MTQIDVHTRMLPASLIAHAAEVGGFADVEVLPAYSGHVYATGGNTCLGVVLSPSDAIPFMVELAAALVSMEAIYETDGAEIARDLARDAVEGEYGSAATVLYFPTWTLLDDVTDDAPMFGTGDPEEEYYAKLAQQCGRSFTTRGADPDSTSCELDGGHSGPHEGPDPLGVDEERIRWTGGGSCAGDPLPAHVVDVDATDTDQLATLAAAFGGRVTGTEQRDEAFVISTVQFPDHSQRQAFIEALPREISWERGDETTVTASVPRTA